MAKGRTNQPLVIWCWYPWVTRPEIVALADAGHALVGIQSEGCGVTAISGSDATARPPDLILHPAAHVWDDSMWDYLKAALAAARARKRKKP